MKKGGLYLHIPYCRKKCLYCDFYSGGTAIADWNGLFRALLSELEIRLNELPEEIVSIYFGGGTPSAMPPELFSKLLGEIKRALGDRLTTEPEITVEINPEDVNEENVKIWKRSGVNRVSIGIESFDNRLLSSIGRRHSGEEAVRALHILKDFFDNVSADLIFGLPGQTRSQWSSDIEELISLKPAHVSAYSLMYEEGTALTLLREKDKVTSIPEEDSIWMFEELSRVCDRAGYERYEISNYSLPGFRSRHNSLYWSGAPYLGLGPSAHSYDGHRTRRANPRDLKGYLRYYAGENSPAPPDEPFYIEEILDDNELREEYLLTRMRVKEGFELAEFRQRFGDKAYLNLRSGINELIKRGEVMIENGRLSLSQEGIMLSDQVILELDS